MLATDGIHDDADSAVDLEQLSDTPTLKTALNGPERDRWLDAIEKELRSIKDEEVYELVNPSEEHIDNLLGNKLVLRRKRGPTGLIERYKARLTARGDHQHKSIDYESTMKKPLPQLLSPHHCGSSLPLQRSSVSKYDILTSQPHSSMVR